MLKKEKKSKKIEAKLEKKLILPKNTILIIASKLIQI